jgi:hypothetical protein
MKFASSPIDPRRLSLPWFNIARQHPGRREHIHGKIHAMDCRCSACKAAA